MAPCPPVPRTEKRSSSLEAMYFPARNPSVPTSSCGFDVLAHHGTHLVPVERVFGQHQRCTARVALFARLEQSEERTSEVGFGGELLQYPEEYRRMHVVAAGVHDAPGVHDRQPMSFCSVIGGVDVGAQYYGAAFGVGFPASFDPGQHAVRAMGRCSMPSSVSRSAMKAAVLCSLNDSSGCACRWRRNSVGFIRVV